MKSEHDSFTNGRRPDRGTKIRDIVLISVGGLLFATLIAVVCIYVVLPLARNLRDDKPESTSPSTAAISSGTPSSEEDVPSSRQSSEKQPSSAPQASSASGEPVSSEESSSGAEISSEGSASSESGGETATVWVQNLLTGGQGDLDDSSADRLVSLFNAVGSQPAEIADDAGSTARVIITTTTGSMQDIIVVSRNQWNINGTLCDITSGGDAFLNYLDSLEIFGGTLSALS